MIGTSLPKAVVFLTLLGMLAFSSCERDLHKAAEKGDVKTVVKLLEQGKKVDSKNVRLETPLLLAAREGHAEVVEKLIAAGADVNAKGIDTRTSNTKSALMFAVCNGHADVVDKLIAAGADVNLKNQYTGETALILAACCGHAEIAKKLIEAGADVNAATLGNHKVLDYAVASKNKVLIKMLEEKGALRGRSVFNPKSILYEDINGSMCLPF